MTDISQTDLDVRLQLSGIKYSELSKRFSNDLKYGKKCTLKHREDLLLLNVYIEMLECYKACVNTTETVSTATLQVTAVTIGAEVIVSVNLPCGGETLIIAHVISTTTNPATFMIALTAAINNSTPVTNVTAEFDSSGDPGIINLSGECVPDCNGGRGTTASVVSGAASISSTGFSAVECTCVATEDGINCITQDELKSIVEKISLLTDICFQPEGFSYLEE